jgi:hypothetical protein
MATKNISFSQSLNANIHKTMLKVNEEVYKIARELFLKIVSLTPSPSFPGPYAKGVLANNWFPVNGSAFSLEKTDEKSRVGAGSIRRISMLRGFNFMKKDGTVTLSNNIEYAYLAEVKGWEKPKWSGNIGPYRMVALSLQAIAARYK